MSGKLIVAVLVAALGIAILMYRAVNSTAKKVVTVAEIAKGESRQNIRLGARVAEGEITFTSSPENLVSFSVRDIQLPNIQISVSYKGLMPDTLKVGRDVILEGDFDGTKFAASQLMTQCPSKYVPPVPGGSNEQH